MRTRLTNIQIETLVRIDEIIDELYANDLNYDKSILIDFCLLGEQCLEFYFEDVEISDNLFEIISELKSLLDSKFIQNQNREDFVVDIIYNYLNNFINDNTLDILSKLYKSNKTGTYANLIINVLKEAQFIDKKLNNVYVNNNILEMIMLYGEDCFYDEFGVGANDLHKKFILACNNFHNQFKEDYPLMLEFGKKGLNYYAKTNCGVKRFIRNIINNIVKYLVIEVKKQPVFISLNKEQKGFTHEICIDVFIGKKYGKLAFRGSYVLDKKFKKSDLKKITSEIEEVINSVDSEFDLDFVLDVVEEKLGVAA
jgi:hypothetical protein